jgi:hypothetical protein
MPKTVVVCCDGTANEFKEDCTNVVKLFSMLVPRGSFHGKTASRGLSEYGIPSVPSAGSRIPCDSPTPPTIRTSKSDGMRLRSTNVAHSSAQISGAQRKRLPKVDPRTSSRSGLPACTRTLAAVIPNRKADWQRLGDPSPYVPPDKGLWWLAEILLKASL